MKIKVITNREIYCGKCKNGLSMEHLKELIRKFINKIMLPRERIKEIIVE